MWNLPVEAATAPTITEGIPRMRQKKAEVKQVIWACL